MAIYFAPTHVMTSLGTSIFVIDVNICRCESIYRLEGVKKGVDAVIEGTTQLLGLISRRSQPRAVSGRLLPRFFERVVFTPRKARS